MTGKSHHWGNAHSGYFLNLILFTRQRNNFTGTAHWKSCMARSELKTIGGALLSAVITTLPAPHKNNLSGSIRIGITDAGIYTGFLPESNSGSINIRNTRRCAGSRSRFISLKWQGLAKSYSHTRSSGAKPNSVIVSRNCSRSVSLTSGERESNHK